MTKSTKKLTAWVVTLLMVFTLFTPVSGTFVKADATGTTGKTVDLIEITDFHGNLLSSKNEQIAAVLAKDIQTVKDNNPDHANGTLVIGGGDLYQGTELSNDLNGVPVQQAMSSMGMEVTALGNHEFDYTLNTINSKTMTGANYEIVCANVRNKSDNSLVYKPYDIFTKDGVKIAVIGAITTETPNIVTPANVADYTFTDPATEINAQAKYIRDNNLADVVLAVVHEGSDSDYATTGPIVNITKQLVGVDAVLGGHSHTIMSTKVTTDAGADVPVEIASCNGKGYIDLKMNISDTGTITFPNASAGSATTTDPTTHTFGAYQAINFQNSTTPAFPYGYYLVTDSSSPAVDQNVYNIVQTANKNILPITSEVLGHTDTALTRTPDVLPCGESYLGNWAADVIKNYASADVGVANNGGLRCDISAGDITHGEVYSFMPFDDNINTVMMSGAQLKQMFENAFADNTGKGVQVSGVKVTYNPKLASGSRVISLTKADGTAIDMTSTTQNIKVAGVDFVLTGGDGFTVFNDAAVKSTLVDTHELVRAALMDDVTKNKGISTTMDYRLKNVGPIEVLATSDNHGALFDYDYATGKPTNAGLTKVSTFVTGQRNSEGSNRIMVVDNGDTIQGTSLSYYFDKLDKTGAEYPMMKAYGYIGYDTWTLGNHEFNYGLDVLNRVIGDANKENIKVLSANTYKTDDKGNKTNFVGTYIIKPINVNGKTINVGILGETTPAIPNWEDASHYAGLTFEKNLVDETQKYVDQMKKAGADVVILTVHSGQPGYSETIAEENQVTAIAEQTSGIDAIVAGHTHDMYADTYSCSSDSTPTNKPYIKTIRTNAAGKPVHITEPKNGATYVSEIDISLNPDGTLNTNNLISTKAVKMGSDAKSGYAGYADDTKFESTLQSYQDTTIAYVNTVIGTSTGAFTGDGQTTRPTAIMDLINKVQQHYAGTQLSIAAPLSATAMIPKGDVKIKDIASVYVFENFLYGVKMTGKQIKDWMELSAKYYKQVKSNSDPLVKDPVLNIPDYNLDVLYGATYTIDRTQPAGHRIKNLMYNGKLINDTDVFTVAINNYRYNGGGGFMDAAGLSMTDPTTGLKVPRPGITTFDSAKEFGDDGQVRNLMTKYIQELAANKKTLDPVVDSKWVAGPATLSVTPSESTIGLNSTMKLTGTVEPDGAADSNIKWTSSNPLIAKVDQAGNVTTYGIAGDVVITAITADGILEGSCTLKVNNNNFAKGNTVTATRLSGINRYETSQSIAASYSNGTKVSNIILTSGVNYPDAISGAVLSASLKAPMLLVNPSGDNSKVYDYIKNNLDDYGKVYILGGTGAVSQSVEDYITKTLNKKVTRYSGKDRFETNANIISALNPKAGTPVIITTSSCYADALSASSPAAINGYPIIITQGSDLSSYATTTIKNIQPSMVYVIGGTGAVPQSVIDEVKAADTALTNDNNIVRISGQNRYETSLNVLNYFGFNAGNLIVATGEGFADALSGVSLAAKEYAPILLTNNSVYKDELTTMKKYSNVTILGGYGVLVKDIETSLKDAKLMPAYIQTSLSATVNVGDQITLPATVTGYYPDGTEVAVDVKWDSKVSLDTSKAGTIKVTGTVEGYDTPVTLTITVE